MDISVCAYAWVTLVVCGMCMYTWCDIISVVPNVCVCVLDTQALLSVIPSMCSELTNSYHDDWLADVLYIVYYVLQ